MKIKTTRNNSGFVNMSKKVDFISKTQLYLGIPQEYSGEDPEEDKEGRQGVTNAELLFIHTNGSKLRNIPERPVIEPVIQKNKKKLHSYTDSAIKTLLETGDEQKALNFLRKEGMQGQRMVWNYFIDPSNGWPPNKPSTIRRKLKKRQTVPRTLIDTNELRKSITYVIVVKGKKEIGNKND